MTVSLFIFLSYDTHMYYNKYHSEKSPSSRSPLFYAHISILCIGMAEVRAVVKKMKRHKAPGLSGLVAEMIQATGDIGTQWILDLCSSIVTVL